MEQKKSITLLKEDEQTELKKSTSLLKEAIISIVAILNKHKQGQLYFGVKNDGTAIGQEISEKTLREISKAISDFIEPKIYPKINKLFIDGKNCIIVDFMGDSIPYFAYGRAYIRVADEDKSISAKELEKLIIAKNKDQLQWDSQVCKNSTIGDIDGSAVKRFLRGAKSANRIKISGDNKILVLKKLGLISGNKITNAAIVLFGRKPRKYFTNVLVKCGRFRGELKEEFFDMRDFEGNLFDCIENSLGFLKDHLRLTAKIEGLYRKEKWEIPIEALREAIINALIHRDYVSTGFTYIKLYDNEIVIANPGKLPDTLKIDDLYKEHESIQRNPLLAEAVYYTGMIDAWGRGIRNIVEMLKEEKLPKPEFEESRGHFRIIFKRPKISDATTGTLNGTLSGTLNQLLGCIKNNPGIQANQISTQLRKPVDTVKKQIKHLVDKGIVGRKGSKKTGGYYIK